jgi:hypothetical protein
MGSKRILLFFVSVLVLAAWVAPPTQAEVPRPRQLLESLVEDPEFPSEWAGVWDITITERECGSSTITDMYTDTDTICTGEIFTEGEEEGVTCDGTITSTTINVTCGGSVSEGGCTITLGSSVNVTRSGETFSGTGQWSVTYTGTCGPFLEDECVDEVYSGARTSGEPPACATVPVLPTTWGVLKARYGAE